MFLQPVTGLHFSMKALAAKSISGISGYWHRRANVKGATYLCWGIVEWMKKGWGSRVICCLCQEGHLATWKLCLPSSSRVSEYKWPPGNRRWSGMCLLNRCNVCEQWYLFSDGDVLIVSFLVVRSQKSQRTNCDVFAASEQSAIDLVADWHAADLLISRVLSSPVATSLIIKLSLSYVHPPLSYFLLHLMHVFQCWYREHNVIFTAAAEVHLCCGW